MSHLIFEELNKCVTAEDVKLILDKHDISLKMKHRRDYMMSPSNNGQYMNYLVDDGVSRGKVKFGNLNRVFIIEHN